MRELGRCAATPRAVLCGCLGWFAAGCGDTPERSAEADPAVYANSGDASTLGLDAATTAPRFLDASGPPEIVSAPAPRCRPGNYAGDFTCLISGLLPWGGKMSFSLVEETTLAGGEFEILQILPGTRISGTDETFAGTFSANLQGKFSCLTGILTGSLDDGTYVVNVGIPLKMAGGLEGHYLADAAVPSFEGTMGPLTTPDLDLLGTLTPSAMCTWKASRTGDVDRDAGVGADASH